MDNPSNPQNSRGSQAKILYGIIGLLVILLVGSAVWFIQQNKINKLENQVAELQNEVDELSQPKDAVSELLEDTTQSARDTERETDIKALHSQLEAYFAQYGYYPTFGNVNDESFRANNLQGLDDGALRDPQGSSAILAASPEAKVYSYEVTPSDCDNDANDCVSYTLTATLESGSTFTRESLN
jgi:type II secretory pathway pseudopilin PulG